jgi:hypothetical protein
VRSFDAAAAMDYAKKANAAYTKWLGIRQKKMNQRQQAWDYQHFVD